MDRLALQAPRFVQAASHFDLHSQSVQTDVITNTPNTRIFKSGATRYLGIALANLEKLRIPVGFDYSLFTRSGGQFRPLGAHIHTGGKTIDWGYNGDIVNAVTQNNGSWVYPAAVHSDVNISYVSNSADGDREYNLPVTESSLEFSDDSTILGFSISPTETAIITGVATICYLAVQLPDLLADLQRIRAYGANAVNTALSMFWTAILIYRGYDEHGNPQ
jgi:hypothetical protein